jgi:hypothetical protein
MRVRVRAGGDMLTISKEITHPGTLGFDRSGNLYVTNGPRRVLEYAPASDRILRATGDGVRNPQALQFGRDGRLYIANWPPGGTGLISVYSLGSSTPAYEIKESIQYPVSPRIKAATAIAGSASTSRAAGH